MNGGGFSWARLKAVLFDLEEDPRELHNLAGAAGEAGRLDAWRRRLVERLRDRPEGFVEGDHLVPGRAHGPTVPGIAVPVRGGDAD